MACGKIEGRQGESWCILASYIIVRGIEGRCPTQKLRSADKSYLLEHPHPDFCVASWPEQWLELALCLVQMCMATDLMVRRSGISRNRGSPKLFTPPQTTSSVSETPKIPKGGTSLALLRNRSAWSPGSCANSQFGLMPPSRSSHLWRKHQVLFPRKLGLGSRECGAVGSFQRIRLIYRLLQRKAWPCDVALYMGASEIMGPHLYPQYIRVSALGTPPSNGVLNPILGLEEKPLCVAAPGHATMSHQSLQSCCAFDFTTTAGPYTSTAIGRSA